jgi:hypothetical protein
MLQLIAATIATYQPRRKRKAELPVRGIFFLITLMEFNSGRRIYE